MNVPLPILEGRLVVPSNTCVAILASRFNSLVVDALITGAYETLLRHGMEASQVVCVRVPGAWELPLAAQRLARSGRFDALIALGAVIRGETPHFDQVVQGACAGLAQVSLATEVPIALGLLTTEDVPQALDRAGLKAGNKGEEAARAALEMVSLGHLLTQKGLGFPLGLHPEKEI